MSLLMRLVQFELKALLKAVLSLSSPLTQPQTTMPCARPGGALQPFGFLRVRAEPSQGLSEHRFRASREHLTRF